MNVSQNFEQIHREMDEENALKPRADRDRQAEREAGYALRIDFGVALGEEYASHLSPALRDIIFEKAWSDGHSSGYHQVESEYDDLVDFVNKARAN